MIIDTVTIVFAVPVVILAAWMLWNHDKLVPDETEKLIHHHSRQPYHPDHEE